MNPRVAVVGTGFIGPVHIEAVRRLGYEVVGIVGSSPARAADRAAALGVSRAYASFEELLADPGVDVVHITTPNRTHFAMAAAALRAGKHVVCEKPLAMDADEGRALVELAAGLPTLVAAVNYNIRFYPLCLQARDLIRAGAIGDILSVRGAYLQDWLLHDTDWNWRLVPEEGGALRAVADIGTHWLDLLTFVTGLEVEQVCADMATFIPVRRKPLTAVATFKGKETAAPTEFEPVRVRTEDWATILLRFGGGPRGVLTVSQVNAGRKNQLTFEVAGTEGALAWDSERPNELWLGHRDRANELLLRDPALATPTAGRFMSFPGGHNEGFPDTFKQLYRAVYAHIVTGAATMQYPTFADGYRELVLCDAIARSAREERWVAVSGS